MPSSWHLFWAGLLQLGAPEFGYSCRSKSPNPDASFLTTTLQNFCKSSCNLSLLCFGFFLRLGPRLRSRGLSLQKRLFFMERVPAAVHRKTQIAAEVKLQSAVQSLAHCRPIEICILEESRETMRVGERGQPARTRNCARQRCGLICKNPRMSSPSQSLSAAKHCYREGTKRRRRIRWLLK